MRDARICPICGKTYGEYPAVSRTDNITEICPDCGVGQSLEAFGADEKMITTVLQTIHASACKLTDNSEKA